MKKRILMLGVKLQRMKTINSVISTSKILMARLFSTHPFLVPLSQWHPTPVLLPGKSYGQRGLVGCSPWGHQEWDMAERLYIHALEKEMATHSSVLAQRIPGMGSLVGCRLWGRTESDMTEATQQQQQHLKVKVCFFVVVVVFFFKQIQEYNGRNFN